MVKINSSSSPSDITYEEESTSCYTITAMTKTNMIPSSLFDLQGGEPQDQRVRKRDSSFFMTFHEFSIGNADGKPKTNIRKALSVLSKAQTPFRHNSLSHNDRKEIPKCSSDALSVCTASTSSTGDEESDMENDPNNKVPITLLPPPDALFIVQGMEFPCHTKFLSKEARPLLDILSRDGVLERKTKRQRTSPSRDQSEEQQQSWSSPSGITVARLSNDVDVDFFEIFMEFLYTKEIRLKLPEEHHEEDEEFDPWLDTEDVFDDDGDNEDAGHLLDLPVPQDAEAIVTSTPLELLQGSFLLADRFGCTSLKNAIENKLYDEFLFSFMAKELYTWADQNKCAYLKEKAMAKILARTSEKKIDSNSLEQRNQPNTNNFTK